MAYEKTDEAIRRLSPEQYRITQQNGTERPGTGEYNDHKEPGIFVDIVSGEPLFASSDKFESGCAIVGGSTAYIEPGSPWENGYCESFNGKLRHELLNRISVAEVFEAGGR